MKKYNVNTDRQKPSSEEILSRRDFDGLMKQYSALPGKVVHKPFFKSGWFIGSMATAAAVAGIIAVYFSNSDPAKKLNQPAPVVKNQTAPADSSSTPAQALAVQATKRQIAPPLPGLNVSFVSYQLNAARGGVITHKNGSKLSFPANAFVDAGGRPVNGNVEIKYREFRDQADFFLSGIPMQYDSAGTTYQFQSAGMMEIAAFVNGKVVYLDKNKKINVEFASKESGTEFNLYKFDTLAGNWNYLGKDQVTEKEPKNDSILVPKDSIAYYSGKGMRTCGHVEDFLQKPVEPVKPLKADKRKNRFTVAINPVEFPEMKAYKDMIFEVDESHQVFNKNWYSITWESIRLLKGKDFNRYQIALTKGDEKVMLDVYPVLDGKQYDKAEAEYELKNADYQEKLAQYNKVIAEQKAMAANGVRDAGNGNVVRNVPDGFLYMTKAKDADNDKAEEVMRAFTVNSFGVYNMDEIAQLPQGRVVNLQVNGADGETFSGFSTLYHVDRNINSLYSYHNENPMRGFHFNPASSNLIWAVKEGKLFYSDNEEFTKIPGGSETHVQLKAVNREFKSPEELKKFFKISKGV